MAIRYDIPEEDLYPILESINAVFFTGGGLNLIDEHTNEQHQYYKTAKKIFDHSKKLKDEKNEDFPILGICQGFELLGMLAAGDDRSVMSDIYYFENRKVEWDPVMVKSQSKMFGNFELSML